jgi:UDP-3-O-[3-hydroxymyristoyl] glucosamine N-acyltransferase
MTDLRFFRRSGPFPLSYLAERIGADPLDAASNDVMIHDIGALETAARGEISVFSDARYRSAFVSTAASAVITSRDLARRVPEQKCLLFAKQPRLAFARIGHLFYPAAPLSPGINASAQIDPSAAIGGDARVDAGAVVGPGSQIGVRCHIGANVVIGAGVIIGEDCRIGANSTVSHAVIGARVVIATNVSIGGEGFGFALGPGGLVRMQQVGRVIIEDDVEIGANCAIDRGATGDTIIGTGTVIDNLVQIGHNVRLGRHCILSGQVGIAGSTLIGDGVMIGGQAAISDHLVIGAGARIAGKSGVMRDVESGVAVGGYPAVPLRQWHRQTAGLLRLFYRKPIDLPRHV